MPLKRIIRLGVIIMIIYIVSTRGVKYLVDLNAQMLNLSGMFCKAYFILSISVSVCNTVLSGVSPLLYNGEDKLVPHFAITIKLVMWTIVAPFTKAD